MSSFRDRTHTNSWDNFGFLKVYVMWLDEKVESGVFKRKLKESGGRFDEKNDGFGPSLREYSDEFDSGLQGKLKSHGDLNESVGRKQKTKGYTNNLIMFFLSLKNLKLLFCPRQKACAIHVCYFCSRN